jgi:protein-S-isoprenylcysteine O-methyltransferase Ste14
MTRDRFKAYTLVFVQMACIIAILATGRLFAGNILLLMGEIAGIVLGIWALIVMGWHNLNVTPLIKEHAQLVTGGPYAVIRHPMYSSVLLTIWSLILDQYSWERLTIGLVLTADLLAKLRYEEELLKKHFAGYGDYMKKTKRLIPFAF